MNISIIKNREFILLLLLGITFITFILSKAINSLSLAAYVIFFFIDYKENIKRKWVQLKNNKIIIVYILFYCVQVVGFFYSHNVDVATRKLVIMSPLLFLPAIISVENLSNDYLNKLLNFLKYSIPIIFIYYLMIHLIVEKRTFNNFVHFTINGRLRISQFYLVFILLIPILVTLKQINQKDKIAINIILLLISILFLLLLGNKTSILFLGLIFIGVIVKKIVKQTKNAFVILLISLIIGVFSYQLPIVKSKLSVVLNSTSFKIKTIITKNRFAITKNTLEHRILIDYLSLKEIKKALPFGVGTGDFQEKLDEQYKKEKFKFGMQGGVNNHNQYLEEFLKTGVLGGFLFLILVFMLLKQGFYIGGFGLVFVLFFAIACMVESYLNRQHGVVIFSFMIPFFLKKRY